MNFPTGSTNMKIVFIAAKANVDCLITFYEFECKFYGHLRLRFYADDAVFESNDRKECFSMGPREVSKRAELESGTIAAARELIHEVCGGIEFEDEVVIPNVSAEALMVALSSREWAHIRVIPAMGQKAN